ncbi:MAG: hypothetical protein RR515_05225 [Clostridium sp.]
MDALGGFGFIAGFTAILSLVETGLLIYVMILGIKAIKIYINKNK